MYDELIKELRRYASEYLCYSDEWTEAADAIEQLLAENERLKEIIRKEEWLCRSK